MQAYQLKGNYSESVKERVREREIITKLHLGYGRVLRRALGMQPTANQRDSFRELVRIGIVGGG